MIHPTAIIAESATLGEDVTVGPYAIIGEYAYIGDGCEIKAHATIGDFTHMGQNNLIYPYAAIGLVAQDKKFQGEEAWLYIGNNNTFREFCTMNRGTGADKGKTVIGNHNLFLAYTHVAHDCELADHIIMSNNASLAGHVSVGDYAILSPFVVIHQFCHLGAHCFIGLGGLITRDVPPFMITSGHPAELRGVNIEGLKRRDFSKGQIKLLRQACKLIQQSSGNSVEQAIEQIKQLEDQGEVLSQLLHFFAVKTRGVLR